MYESEDMKLKELCVCVTYGILQQMSEFAVPVGDVWSLLRQSSQDVGQS